MSPDQEPGAEVSTMGFTVDLFTLSKRDNSTKQPTGTGTQFSCILKSGSGIMHPVLTFDFGKTSDPSQYNYAYIPAFDRYYFIEEWYFDRALWTASLKVDVLATYKTEIGGASLYVLRAAGANDGSIIDTLYPSKTGCSFSSDTKTNPWDTSSSFVVGCVSANASMGSIKYYVLGSGQMAVLCQALLDKDNIINNTNGFDLGDASAALQLSLVDPIQYIKTCVMLPVAYTDMVNYGSAEQVVVFNFTPAAIQGVVIQPNTRVSKTYSFSIPKHPDTNARGNYVNSSPFTKLTLTIPPWGCIDIDSSVTCNASTLSVNVDLDPITGKAVLVISANGIILNRLESQVGVPISLSSVTRDYIGAATSALGAVGGLVHGLTTGSAGGFIGAASGIGNAVEALMPRAQTIGSTGAFVSNRGDFRLDAQFFRPVADDNTHNGRPLCQVRQINSLSGYMLIQDGDVAINGTSAEDAEVRNYLESGFYYE